MTKAQRTMKNEHGANYEKHSQNDIEKWKIRHSRDGDVDCDGDSDSDRKMQMKMRNVNL